MVLNKELCDNVKFLSEVPESLLQNLYAACNIFVFPTLFEGFGLPVLEAMVCAKPIVSTNICSIPEVSNGFGILVPPKNFTALADAINILLNDENLRRKVGHLAWQKAQNLGLERTFDKCQKFLKSIDRRSSEL
jgi:glycosyltransferase involved in cell wall biosynthesis